MSDTPEYFRRKLDEIQNQLNSAIASNESVMELTQLTQLNRVLADLKARFGQFIEAGITLVTSIIATIEAAASEAWRWLSK